MTIVLPHGVLFRGDAGDGSEGSIRQQLIENDNIEAIIGLPSDIFFGTGIPTIVMVLRKSRPTSDVLIIDASKGFKKEGKKNKLRASDIKRIVDTYVAKKEEPKFSRLVSKEEIRANGYNLNIPRYVNSSDDVETWDLYATMFGGIPKSELTAVNDYWEAFAGLEDSLFKATETPQTEFKVEDIRKTVETHPSVIGFKRLYDEKFGGFSGMLHHHLLDNMLSLNIAAEEDAITSYIFKQLEQMPLVDRFEAYQLFADKWQTVSQDLEIIQSEGFEATRVVDANMVVKKKDDKEYEVQDGWIGRILPFELVQSTYLKSEWQALHDKEERLDMIGLDMEETLGELADDERDGITNDDGALDKKSLESKLAEALEEVETPEILALNEYLLLSKKKDKMAFIEAHDEINWKCVTAGKDGTYGKAAVNSLIGNYRANFDFPEDSYESRLIKINRLLNESKVLKSEIKVASVELHEHTKVTIEQELADEDIMSLLSMKWIESLCSHLSTLPQTIIDDFTNKLVALQKKYATMLVDLEHDIHDASVQLADMIDELTGNEYDMAALQEFKKVLVNA